MQENSDIEKFSKLTHLFIEIICSNIPDRDSDNLSDEIYEFTKLINLNRHRIKDMYKQNLGTPEDQKVNLCLLNTINRLLDLRSKDEIPLKKYDRITSELRKMAETDKVSEYLSRYGSEL
jgi:hypothetical protein